MDLIEGQATPEGTRGYQVRHPQVREAHGYRKSGDLQVSSIGLGTYLGEVSPERDEGYKAAIVAALSGGINVVDTAINYRHQRSERVIHEALREFFEADEDPEGRREEVFVATKGGYLPLDGDVEDPHKKVQEDYVESGLVTPETLMVDAHCMEPAYLEDQIGRSRRNLGLETIDLYYVHNPETQLAQVAPQVFEKRLGQAFLALEKNVAAGRIGHYGVATWAGLRAPLDHKAHLSLERMLAAAQDATREAGHEQHHFAAVQAPLNLGMPEAVTEATQRVGDETMPLCRAVQHLGLSWFTSASLMQGKLAEGIPFRLQSMIGAVGDAAQTALQATRSAPGVTSALVGMSSRRHVESALGLLRSSPPGASGVWPDQNSA